MTKAEQIKQLMKEYGQFERQAKTLLKKSDDAWKNLWLSPEGSAEAKRWNAEWKQLEAEGHEFRRKANKILDRVERLKEQNPRYLVTAKQKTVRDVDLGILEDKSAAKAISRAKGLYAGKGYTGMKAKKRNPSLTKAEIEELPFLQRNKVENEIMSAGLSGAKINSVILNTDKSVSVMGTNAYGTYTSTYDRKGKLKNPARRRNKTIITKPKKVVVINSLKKLRNGKVNHRQFDGYVRQMIREGFSANDILEAIRRAGFDNDHLKAAAKLYAKEASKIQGGQLSESEKRILADLTGKKNPYQDLVIKGFAQKTPQGWKIGKKTIPQGKGIVSVSSGYKLDRATGTVFAKRMRNPSQSDYYREKTRIRIRKMETEQLPAARELLKLAQAKLARMRKNKRTERYEIQNQLGTVDYYRKSLKELVNQINEEKGYLKSRQNVAQGFFDGNGVFHPIRSSADYDSGRAGEGRGSAVKHPVSKKRREAMRKASYTARDKASYRVPIAGDTRRSRKNVAQGFFDGNGVFHPIRSSGDYDGGRAGETGSKKPIRTRSKKRKASLKKAGQTARLKAETKRRKSTASRLASRSLSKSAGILKGSGSRRQRKNPALSGSDKQVAWAEKIREALLKDLDQRERRYSTDWADVRQSDYWDEIKNWIDANVLSQGSAAWWIDNRNKNWIQTASAAVRPPRVRRNPSPAENRREFAGHYSKDSSLRFPDGTPTGLSKLGTLKLIKLASGHELKPGIGTTWLCRDQKGKLHLGTTRLDGIVYNGDAGDLGKVKLIEYDERKDHLYPGEGVLRFYHRLGEDDGIKPSLISDGKGGLRFKGGNYKIESRGIVN